MYPLALFSQCSISILSFHFSRNTLAVASKSALKPGRVIRVTFSPGHPGHIFSGSSGSDPIDNQFLVKAHVTGKLEC